MRDRVAALEAQVRDSAAALGTARAALQDSRATVEYLHERVVALEAQVRDSAAELGSTRAALQASQADAGQLRQWQAEAECRRNELAAELRAVTERYVTTLAGAPQVRDEVRFTDAELLSSLREAGVPASADDRVTLHVGFGHSATTSLQTAFFGRRDDLFYAGVPYNEAGGFFSYLKYTDDHLLDPAEMLRLCRDTVYAPPARRARPIVVSDELFTEPAEVYYHPHILPGTQVAARLKRYFPTARILFTIRSQADYVASMYFNLKRNFGFLAGMPVPPFEEWWEGVVHTQVRGPYLLNLDYAPMIRVFVALFGRENVFVLPLEELKARGDRAYLEKLCGYVGIPFRDADLEEFRRPRNGRMTVVEARMADLIAARVGGPVARQVFESESLAGLMAGAPRASLQLGEDQLSDIRGRVSHGNQWLAAEFGLPLGEWGYFV